jgi:hypothetical protein
VPAVYARYGDVIDLYVFTAPASGYPTGIQLGELSLARPPALGGARTWTVTVPLDTSPGTPRRCLAAAQPTHDFEGAPSANYQVISRRGRQCGIDAFPHRFRRHFSHTWLDHGGAEGDLMELNGWASPRRCSAATASAPRAARARRSYDRVIDGTP